MSAWSRDDLRIVIRYNFTRGLSIDECLQEMKSALKVNCPHRTTIYRWYCEFKRENFDVADAPRSGRPSDVCTPDNVAKVEEMLRVDRRITYSQIEEALGISAPSVHKILHDILGVRKVCTLWVPHDLTAEQKDCRVKWCKKMQKKFENGTSAYTNSIVTGDETWLYYYDVPSKSRNKVWLFENEPTPTQPRKSRSVKKKMIAVFFSKRGLLDRVVLDSQRTVTANWYTNECLPRVLNKLKEIRPNSRLDTWFFHHDNAPAHRAAQTVSFFETAGIKMVEHPPYSPDLAPCDFALFPFIKDKLKGRKFTSDEELLSAWDHECAVLPENKWIDIFDDWFLRMTKCINCDGNYFERL